MNSSPIALSHVNSHVPPGYTTYPDKSAQLTQLEPLELG